MDFGFCASSCSTFLSLLPLLHTSCSVSVSSSSIGEGQLFLMALWGTLVSHQLIRLYCTHLCRLVTKGATSSENEGRSEYNSTIFVIADSAVLSAQDPAFLALGWPASIISESNLKNTVMCPGFRSGDYIQHTNLPFYINRTRGGYNYFCLEVVSTNNYRLPVWAHSW